MTNKMFSEKKLSHAGEKNSKVFGIKSFYSSISYGLEYEKTASVNYLLKCP